MHVKTAYESGKPIEDSKPEHESLEPSNSRVSYYAQATSWADDRRDALERSRRLAWWISIIAICIAVMEAFALAALVPLKRIEPFALLVDRQTGFVQILKGDGVERITADESLVQSMLAQYVVARESFDINTLARDYRKVGLWSAARARSNYLAAMRADSVLNPINNLPRTTVVETRIKSVSRLSPSTALVRFDTVQIDQGLQGGNPKPWVALLRFRFAKASMSFDDRLINPLGFQVLSYRRDQEAPPLAPATPIDPDESAKTDDFSANIEGLQ